METEPTYLHISFEEFLKIETPYELHKLAVKCYFYIQEWIVESELCSEATALMIFWNNSPFEHIRIGWKTRKGTNEDFDLTKTIITNFERGLYLKTEISYDPTEKINEIEKIPNEVLEACNGEEPYLYLEEKEIQTWFGEYLENQIQRCESTIELYNVAIFLKHKELDVYKTVIEHQFCDKAIALMIYWRLEKYSNLSLYAEDWLEIKPILEKIVQKIKNNEYAEILTYNPNTEVNPIKWEIPKYLFNKMSMYHELCQSVKPLNTISDENRRRF
ncbi:hypothetical protein EZJ43_16125 [Pedobacter changchengzhani]|uniref:DUF4274 domain-containing protein n=1 Tax=Pedobacter changchengzhani TaxID=2529274 RepID=A0A4R5MHG4_9SPHI|nr:hypothetical protein [Pedobacter changchengzhani]TDG34968.1 hypothetical protein EZJ43_16125 [Pedobacter changchengzhani]